MSKTITLATYRDRILGVVDYVWKHIDRDVDVNTLAEVAHFSPYHFHRIYREMMHETVNSTVRRLRLHYAARELLRSDLSVESVARKLGYGSGEAFSRAFSKQYDETPTVYRRRREAELPSPLHVPDLRTYPMNFSVETLQVEPIHLGALPHLGDYLEIGAVFERVFVTAASKQLLGPHTRSIGIYYDDPFNAEDRDALRSHACISASPEQAKAAGLETLKVGGHEYAVMTFVGPYAELEKAYRWFYGEWLPNSGRELADEPPFEEYLNDPKQVVPSELRTKIYLPLA
jgi:AraC family transcriptional regulator